MVMDHNTLNKYLNHSVNQKISNRGCCWWEKLEKVCFYRSYATNVGRNVEKSPCYDFAILKGIIMESSKAHQWILKYWVKGCSGAEYCGGMDYLNQVVKFVSLIVR